VVRRLAADLDTGTEIVVCPTVRDVDGLALSSRNARLDPAERRQALAIPAALAAADDAFRLGERDAEAIRDLVLRRLAESPGLAVDYVAVVDAEAFLPITNMHVRCEILIAARMGQTRLIDVLTPGTDERLAVGLGG
jgi:pantoate--beta-alanine ligase